MTSAGKSKSKQCSCSRHGHGAATGTDGCVTCRRTSSSTASHPCTAPKSSHSSCNVPEPMTAHCCSPTQTQHLHVHTTLHRAQGHASRGRLSAKHGRAAGGPPGSWPHVDSSTRSHQGFDKGMETWDSE